MSKIPGIPKLVNVSDTSDSDSSENLEKDDYKSEVRSKSRSFDAKSRSRSGSIKSRSRSKSRDRSRSHSREAKSRRSRSRSKESSSRNSRSHSREIRNRKSSRHSSKDRRRSRDRKRHRKSRSPSPRRHRRRSKSPPRRHRSPPRPSRSSKTMATLDKLGIELKPPVEVTPMPTYYNQNVVNPNRYAQQIAKRKLIWGKKSSESSPSPWQGATFSQDQDGKMTSKFKRLMGIKGENSTDTNETNVDLIKRQQEMFSSMEIQYEAARQATHTQRGVGLGFGAGLHPQ